jgi:integrase
VTVALPYRWTEDAFSDVLARCRVIAALMATEGLDLRAAALAASGKSSRQVEDWAGAIEAFEAFKRNHGRVVVSDRTWQTKYDPFLQGAVELVQARKATTGQELLEQLASRWQPGSVMRTHAVRALAAFLKFAVERRQFRVQWMPPASLRNVVGAARAAKGKRVGYPLQEAEVLRLIEGISKPELRFTVELMACFGLRPEDLRHLAIRGGELWSLYRKAGGGGVTEPRQLYPLLVEGQDWNLKERFVAGEPITALGSHGNAGDVLGRKLRRLPVWQALRAEVAARGETLTCYSLRHRYVKQGQTRGIPPKVLADACGHSLQSHLAAYSGWSDAEVTARFFDEVRRSV